MKPSYIIAATAAVFQAVSLNAQNFNPKVEVTNTYEIKAIDVKKQDIPMNVPDSLLQFVYNVDYSVFDNPYKGSYEFKPYMIEMTPEAKPSDARRLFIRAGAGYTLHPEMDFVWTPMLKHDLHLSVYDRFRGYYGPFGSISGDGCDHGVKGVGQFIYGKLPACGDGYLFDNRAGLDIRYNARDLRFDIDAAYRLLASGDTLSSHMFHALDLTGCIIPHRAQGVGYFQGADIHVVSGKDSGGARYSFRGPEKQAIPHFVTDLGGSSTFAGALNDKSRIAADVALQAVFNHGVTDMSAFNVYVTPKYQISSARASLSAGLRLSFLGSSDPESCDYAHKGQIVYPDIRASFSIFPDRLTVYGSITGGDRINTYNSLLERNPFMDSYLFTMTETKYADPAVHTLDSSSESVNFQAGLKGTAGAHFKYDLSAGYVKYKNGLCDAVAYREGLSGRYLYGAYTYCDYDLTHASASLLWKSPRVDVQGRFRFADTRFVTSEGSPVFAVAESRYSGGLSFTYNWQSRLYAGIYADVASARSGCECVSGDALDVPGYVDLGVNLSFKATDRWTIWAKGGNLLNDAVQQYFMHCEKGVNFTLGFCWNM